VERWEEHPGYSPSTIAAEIAGLVAASRLAAAAGDTSRASLYAATADDYQRNVKTRVSEFRGDQGLDVGTRQRV
jgi:glucoamylase